MFRDIDGHLPGDYFPNPLVIHLTAKHLRVRAKTNPLKAAVRDALSEAGVERRAVVGENSVFLVRVRERNGHAARYYIPDALWGVLDRHSRGLRVQPGQFALQAVYREPREWTEADNKILAERKTAKATSPARRSPGPHPRQASGRFAAR